MFLVGCKGGGGGAANTIETVMEMKRIYKTNTLLDNKRFIFGLAREVIEWHIVFFIIYIGPLEKFKRFLNICMCILNMIFGSSNLKKKK
jgi:hypothetical protein